jgi:toxin ParE1/3/4
MAYVDFSDKSKSDIAVIKSFIAQDNPERAVSYIKEALGKFIRTVGAFPSACPKYSKRNNIRRYVSGDYNIYYKYNRDTDIVEVLHIIHSSQIINSLFLD